MVVKAIRRQSVRPPRTTATSSRPERTAAPAPPSSSVSDFKRFLKEFEIKSALSDSAEELGRKSLGAFLKEYEAVEERWRIEQRETADGFNVLGVLELTRNELRHSMLVAWLLDQDIRGYGTHAQGNLGFRLFLEECPELSSKRWYAEKPYTVRREVAGDESRVDIRIAAPGWFVVDIENKILSGEGEDQTGRESRDLHVVARALRVPESDIHAFFLTPDRRPAANHDFKPISYELISGVLDRFAEEAKPPDVQLFAKHYAEALRKYVISESSEKRMEQYEEPNQ